MARDPLPTGDIENALVDLPGWTYAEHKLEKTFGFKTFREAVSFLVRVAFEAEALDHHPEIWNVYGRVKLTLTTHDAGDRVTAKDLELARKIQRLSWV
jgi:4a-hydroxytetrahydrobiopterin dehydratase